MQCVFDKLRKISIMVRRNKSEPLFFSHKDQKIIPLSSMVNQCDRDFFVRPLKWGD
jgi:hypothetical protein